MTKKKLLIERNPDLEKYKISLQFVIDVWAATRISSVELVDARPVHKEEFRSHVMAYLDSNPKLDIRDFGFMYILLKQKKYPEEVIEDIAKFFERGAHLQELLDAYKARG